MRKLMLPFILLLIAVGIYGNTVSSGIVVPDGYELVAYTENSYSYWIQDLPLKTENSIQIYDGSVIIHTFYIIYGVVDKPLLFKKDLEQCADYCMRFWAEYHREQNKLDKLYLFNYSGEKKYFSSSGKKYLAFLENAMIYSNSFSLKKGCSTVNPEDLSPGDMFVQNQSGGIGHVSMVVNVCENNEGERLYLVGYGYMPAQEFHIEKASDNYGIEGWFTLEGYYSYLDRYFDFGKPVLRRF